MTDPEIITNLGFDNRTVGTVSLKDPQMPGGSDDFGKKLKDSQAKIEENRDNDELLSLLSGFIPLGQASSLFSLRTDDKRTDDQFISELKNAGLLGSRLVSSSEKMSSDIHNPGKNGPSASSSDEGAKAGSAGKAIEQLQKMIIKNRAFLSNANLIPLSEFSKDLARFTARIDVQGIIDKIVENASLLKTNGKTEFVIQLKPQWLGDLTLNISSEKGVLNVQIFAGESAKALLDSSLQELEESLKAANLNIGTLSVSVNSQQNRQQEFKGGIEGAESLPYVSVNSQLTGTEVAFQGLEAFYYQMALGLKKAESIYKEI